MKLIAFSLLLFVFSFCPNSQAFIKGNFVSDKPPFTEEENWLHKKVRLNKAASSSSKMKHYFYVNVNQPNSVKADAGENVEILEGESIQIGGSPSAEFGYGNYTYQWSPEEFLDDPTSANPIATPKDSITYRLIVTDEKNCTSQASIHVEVIHPEPILDFVFNGQDLFSNHDIQICQNERITLNLASIQKGRAPFEVTLEINGQQIIISGVDLENTQLYDDYPEVGQHTITITSIIDATGTSVASPESVYYAVISVSPLPEVSITASGDLEFCDGETVELSAPEAQSYQWSNEETSQTIDVTQSGEFYVTITDNNGCSNTSEVVAVVVHSLPEISCSVDTAVMLTHSPFELTSALPAGGVYHGAGVQDGMFDAASAQPGNHIITYTFESNYGCISECQFVITVVLDTSIPEFLIPFEVKIFPNPAQAILNIEANENIREIRMIDLLGQVLYNATINNMEHQISISEYQNGVYFIQLLTSRGVTTHKVQINKSVF